MVQTQVENTDSAASVPSAFTLDQIVDVLHCCCDEAAEIANRIAGPRGKPNRCPDGVQVLDDAETIVRAAFHILANPNYRAGYHEAYTLPIGGGMVVLLPSESHEPAQSEVHRPSETLPNKGTNT